MQCNSTRFTIGTLLNFLGFIKITLQAGLQHVKSSQLGDLLWVLKLSSEAIIVNMGTPGENISSRCQDLRTSTATVLHEIVTRRERTSKKSALYLRLKLRKTIFLKKT